jgi:hypothetical protein
VFRDGFLQSAHSEPRATEEASSYVTEEFEGGLTLSKRAERSEAEAALQHPSETVTNGFVPSDVPDAEIEISDGFEISSRVVAGGPPTVVKETDISHQLRPEAASPHSTEAATDEPVSSDVEEIEVSDGYETSSAVVVAGSPTVAKGTRVPQTTTYQRRTIVDDTMSYTYPKYSNHPDAAAHVKQFRSIIMAHCLRRNVSSP